jgi:hypothetical protein
LSDSEEARRDPFLEEHLEPDQQKEGRVEDSPQAVGDSTVVVVSQGVLPRIKSPEEQEGPVSPTLSSTDGAIDSLPTSGAMAPNEAAVASLMLSSALYQRMIAAGISTDAASVLTPLTQHWEVIMMRLKEEYVTDPVRADARERDFHVAVQLALRRRLSAEQITWYRTQHPHLWGTE